MATRALVNQTFSWSRPFADTNGFTYSAMLAVGWRSFYHAALRGHERSGYRGAQYWDVSHASVRRTQHGNALAITKSRRETWAALLRNWNSNAGLRIFGRRPCIRILRHGSTS